MAQQGEKGDEAVQGTPKKNTTVEDHRFAALLSIILLTAGVIFGIFYVWCSPERGACQVSDDRDIAVLGVLLVAAIAPLTQLMSRAFGDYFSRTKEP